MPELRDAVAAGCTAVAAALYELETGQVHVLEKPGDHERVRDSRVWG
jgi:hypothetical protein